LRTGFGLGFGLGGVDFGLGFGLGGVDLGLGFGLGGLEATVGLVERVVGVGSDDGNGRVRELKAEPVDCPVATLTM
jgi:hypothetical protein